MEGGMVYQDEDGNLIMYHGDGMGEDDDEMGDEYGMEGSPEVSDFVFSNCFYYSKRLTSTATPLLPTCLHSTR
jgi:hypothetical protein